MNRDTTTSAPAPYVLELICELRWAGLKTDVVIQAAVRGMCALIHLQHMGGHRPNS
jgi:hypothetical protein